MGDFTSSERGRQRRGGGEVRKEERREGGREGGREGEREKGRHTPYNEEKVLECCY